MKPVKFKGQNCIIAKNQKPYLPLPVYKAEDGLIVSCWKVSFIEWLQIIFTRKIYIAVLTFNKSLQPMKCSLKNLFIEE